MKHLLERLLTGAMIWRLVAWFLFNLSLIGILWLSLIAPLLQQQTQSGADNVLLQQQYQHMSNKLHQYKTTMNTVLIPASPLLPVLDLVQTSGMTLIRWQPKYGLSQPVSPQQSTDSKAAPLLNELVLLGHWSQLPPLFGLLADNQVLPQSFSVIAKADYLQITLYLDINDEI